MSLKSIFLASLLCVARAAAEDEVRYDIRRVTEYGCEPHAHIETIDLVKTRASTVRATVIVPSTTYYIPTTYETDTVVSTSLVQTYCGGPQCTITVSTQTETTTSTQYDATTSFLTL